MTTWTAAQAAKKLKVRNTTVGSFVRKGLLKDYGVRQEGKKKNVLKLSRAEVIEFAKTYRPKSHYKNYVKPIPVLSNGTSPVGRLTSLENEVKLLREDMNKLIALWS